LGRDAAKPPHGSADNGPQANEQHWLSPTPYDSSFPTGGTKSTLIGGSDDDILIGGTTAYDMEAGLKSLNAVMAYWSGTADDYPTRVANLTSGNGVPIVGEDDSLWLKPRCADSGKIPLGSSPSFLMVSTADTRRTPTPAPETDTWWPRTFVYSLRPAELADQVLLAAQQRDGAAVRTVVRVGGQVAPTAPSE